VIVTLAERLASCYSGAVYDVLRGRDGRHCVLPKSITPLIEGKKIAGPAFTVGGSPKSGISADDSLLSWVEFLSRAPTGHIVVMEGNTSELALMGELSSEALQRKGVLGFISDGACRDCDFIRRVGFQVYCQGRSPRDVVGAWTPDTFGEPVVIGGCRVSTGDYVLGDLDGVVVIPGAIVETVIAEVEAVMRTENLVRKAILEGVDPKEAYLRYRKF
jgi:4-hydroxy-4-methyl-2-oxoglutarate aldolase